MCAKVESLNVGGLVGDGYSTNDYNVVKPQINNAYYKGNIKVNQTVDAYDFRIGGLAARWSWNIKNSYFIGNITTEVENNYNYVGGIIALANNNQIFEDCYTASTIGSDVTNRYGAFVGSISGLNGTVSSNNVFIDETTASGIPSVGEGSEHLGSTVLRKDTEDMFDRNTYTNWDFINTWDITSSYPFHKVSVGILPPTNLQSITSSQSIMVSKGTPFEQLNLPVVAKAFTQDDQKNLVTRWVKGNYNENIPGTYILYGEYFKDTTFTNTNDNKPSIEIIVAPFITPIEIKRVEIVPLVPKVNHSLIAKAFDAETDGSEISTELTYQWKISTNSISGFLPIEGATSQTYIPTVEDVGKYLLVSVTYNGVTIDCTTPAVEHTILASIAVINQPNKTNYTVNDTLDLTGLSVEAKFSDGTTKTLTDSDYTLSISNGASLNTVGEQIITITYAEGIITKTATFKIIVWDSIPLVKTLSALVVSNTPNKTDYVVGETLDMTGAVIKGIYSDNTTINVATYTTTPSAITPLTLADTTVTVGYTDGEVTKTTTFPINVTFGQVTINFETNGGSPVSSITQYEGTQIARSPITTRANYTFGGWYKEIGFINMVVFPYTITENTTLYAKWIYNNDNNSSNSDSDSDSSTTTNTSNITTITPTTDKIITEQLKNGKAPIVRLSGDNNIVTLTGETLDAVAEGKKDLTVIKDIVTITLSTAIIESLKLDSTDKFEIRMNAVTPLLDDAIKNVDTVNQTLLKKAVDITIKDNGTNVSNFNHLIAITFDVSAMNLTDSQKDKLTGVKFLENGRIKQLGGKVSNNKITFYTSSLSQYGVIISDTLVKISTTIGKTSYTLNSIHKTTDVSPILIDGRTMVPVRFIAEAFGADVSWVEETQTVGIKLDNQNLIFTVGYKSSGMDVVPIIVNSRTLVPLRYVSEQLGANVVWNEDSKTIDIYR